MRSIFGRILLWLLGTVALSLVAFWVIARLLEHRGPDRGDAFGRAIALIEDDVVRSFEEGGPARLAEHLRRVDQFLPGTHFLTDPGGRDLASGEDRSDLLRQGRIYPEPPRLVDGRFILIGTPRQGRFRLISVVTPWPGPWSIWPYYGAVVLVIVLSVWILAVHLAGPLRRLRKAVDRFGQGDLSTRFRSTRKDEIGELSRAFDRMADRIETLLSAERRLLQDVSHELRSPLARLGFAIELARTSADQGTALDRIQRDVGRLSVLVNELLQLTRAECDPGARLLDEVQIDNLLASVIEDCTLEAAAKECRFEFRCRATATVRGDPELLRRALENVIRNAIRHSPDGATIDVDIQGRNGSVAIVVRDRGPGVPADALESIFEPFFRVESDRGRNSGGVGLGLAIARRAVALHQGRIVAVNANPGLQIAIGLPCSAPS